VVRAHAGRRGGPENSSLLSLTFDQSHGKPGDAKPAKQRPRSAPRTLRASLAALAVTGTPAPVGAPAPAGAGPFPPPPEVTPPLAEGAPPPEDWARTSFVVAP
jgi:hypothetical protein